MLVLFAIGLYAVPDAFAESPNALGKTIKIYDDKICLEDYCKDGSKLRITLEGNIGVNTDEAIKLKIRYCFNWVIYPIVCQEYVTIAESTTKNLGGGSFTGDITINHSYLEGSYDVIGVLGSSETGRVGLTMMEIIKAENEETGGFFVEWPDDNEVEFASATDSDFGTMRFIVFDPNGNAIHTIPIKTIPVKKGISQDTFDEEGAQKYNLKPVFENTPGFVIAGGAQFLNSKSEYDSVDYTCNTKSKQFSQEKITTVITYVDEFLFRDYLEGVVRDMWNKEHVKDENGELLYPLYKITSEIPPMIMTLDIPTKSLGQYEIFVTQQAYGSELASGYGQYVWKKSQIIDSEIIKKEQLNKRNAILACTFEISPPEQKLPTWIKNNAEWWAAGQIDETSFLTGIKFLIENNIIILPDTTKSAESSQETIPEWVKNNAGWWAQGAITEDDFIIGLQFLVENGIINMN
ncbi:MAG: hypothetical protein O3C48_08445 [Crenarchaeota archaeon]|nr:hypothetical protein [Thermoproteota archaeon]